MKWFDAVADCKPRVILTHGEDEARSALADAIRKRHKLKAELPALNEVLQFN
jgi:metallo-beta-lactamase family protein